MRLCASCDKKQDLLKGRSSICTIKRYPFARYLRIHELIPALLQRVDNEEIAYSGSDPFFLKATEQEELERVLGHKKYKINMEKATLLRNHSDSSGLDAEKIEGILSGEIGKKAKVKKHVGVQIKAKVLSRFFKPEQKPKEIQRVIEKALEMYFGSLDND